jgi:glyoxylase-like metal-dependent hydrolase (beta-lactamase superfamily II)
MNAIHYPFNEDLPELGQVYPVTEGIYWLRMKLPFALNHINLWLLRDSIDGVEGWTAVDCGITTQETKDAWEQIFANHLEGLPIIRVLVTHMHPDHVGLAHWLCERFQAPLWMSMTDFLMAKWLSSKEGGMSIGSVSGGGGSADHFFGMV